jgi:omega-6 fatty acid desaturase (delta-12 desaturase)
MSASPVPSKPARLLRYADALVPTTVVLTYIAAAYLGGFAALIFGGWVGWIGGVLLTAHGMVIAAYMIHECAHNSVFRDPAHNARLGRVLCWITAACYGTYEEIRDKHMRHHVDRADVVFLDYREILRARPWLRRTLATLEWFHVPATEVMMHALVLWLPFRTSVYRHNRTRVVVCLAVRGGAFLTLAWFAWPAAAGYVAAYLLLLIVLRIMDMHQHTYEVFVTLGTGRKGPPKEFDRAYEHRNTFSNALGRSRLLNLVVLNFGFHNAHHERPAAPWYRLPRLNRDLFGDDAERFLPFANVLRGYHRYRVARVMNEDHGDMDVGTGPDKGLGFVGVYGVSFLTAL